jgi:hypothetical protein
MDGNANGADLNGEVTAAKSRSDAATQNAEALTGIDPAPKPLRLKSKTRRAKLEELQGTTIIQCEICQEPLTMRTLKVDHDHAHGHARGFLCNLCNTGLGHFEDSIIILNRAVHYLKDKNRKHSVIDPRGGALLRFTKQRPLRIKPERPEGPDRLPFKWHKHQDGRRYRCDRNCQL